MPAASPELPPQQSDRLPGHAPQAVTGVDVDVVGSVDPLAVRGHLAILARLRQQDVSHRNSL
jgi:hypothetical protein